MYRSTHPFRSALVRPRRASRATRNRPPFALDLATWLARLSPANGPLPVPAAEPPPLLGALPSLLEERTRAAA
jgi:hypothetical protein